VTNFGNYFLDPNLCNTHRQI